MPNGDKNIGNDDIELLPPEFRKPEEKRKKEERPEVKLFIPETEEKPQKPTFVGKFFSSKQETKPAASQQKIVEEANLSVFKMQREVPKAATPSPPVPPRSVPPPPPQKIVPPPIKPSVPPPQKPAPPQKIEYKPEQKRPQNGAPKEKISKPSGEKMPPDITLIPAEEGAVKEKRGKSRQIIILVATAIILVLVGGGLYWVLKFYQEQADFDLQKIEADLGVVSKKNQDLNLEKTEAQFFQKKLKTAEKLLENHLYWTNFFSFLEKNTVADVYFVNLIGGSDGQIVMSGVAKSYAAMSRQIVAFRADERISKVSVLSASASVDTEGNVTEINFDAKLQLNPEIFLK